MEYERTQEKTEVLYQIYKKGLEEGRFSSMRDACRYICKQPAPCFYISGKWASIYIGQIEAGISLMGFSTNMARKLKQLYANYKKYCSEHSDEILPREHIMDILVEQPAPEFYMTPNAVRKVLRKALWKVRRKYGLD